MICAFCGLDRPCLHATNAATGALMWVCLPCVLSPLTPHVGDRRRA